LSEIFENRQFYENRQTLPKSSFMIKKLISGMYFMFIW